MRSSTPADYFQFSSIQANGTTPPNLRPRGNQRQRPQPLGHDPSHRLVSRELACAPHQASASANNRICGGRSQGSTRPSTAHSKRGERPNYQQTSGGSWAVVESSPLNIRKPRTARNTRVCVGDKLSNNDQASAQPSTDWGSSPDWQSQFYHTKLCPFYVSNIPDPQAAASYGDNVGNAEGNCANGQRCRFAHSFEELRPLPDLSKTKLCSSYTRKSQCKEPDCPFAHCPQDLRTSSSNFYKVSLCNFHKSHKCWNGANCRFAHGEADLRAAGEHTHSASASSSSSSSSNGNNPIGLVAEEGFLSRSEQGLLPTPPGKVSTGPLGGGWPGRVSLFSQPVARTHRGGCESKKVDWAAKHPVVDKHFPAVAQAGGWAPSPLLDTSTAQALFNLLLSSTATTAETTPHANELLSASTAAGESVNLSNSCTTLVPPDGVSAAITSDEVVVHPSDSLSSLASSRPLSPAVPPNDHRAGSHHLLSVLREALNLPESVGGAVSSTVEQDDESHALELLIQVLDVEDAATFFS